MTDVHAFQELRLKSMHKQWIPGSFLGVAAREMILLW